MAIKRGLDQVTGWILAVVLASGVFAGGYFGTKYVAKHQPDDADERMEPAKGEEVKEESKEEAKEEKSEKKEEAKEEAKEEKSEKKEEAKEPDPSPSLRSGSGSQSEAHWDYKGSTGADHWGELTEAYKTCRAGKRQSPVDIDAPKTDGKLLPIKFHYKEADAVVKNTGKTIRATFPQGNFIEIDGDRYDLTGFEFHAPSEHKVSGIPYDFEAHLIHKNSEGHLAIIAVLFEEGTPNKALAKIWKALPGPGEQDPEPIAFDPATLLPTRKLYYRYQGSITTPPCTEGVMWSVMMQPVTISTKQVDEFVRVVPFNARPVQSLGTRKLIKSSR